jgi:multidrug transporter EmrE-like cation transporter
MNGLKLSRVVSQKIVILIFTLGIVLVYIAFLFQTWNVDLFFNLFIGGGMSTLLSYLVLVFGKRSRRTKVILSLILACSILILLVSVPLLQKSSYRIYLEVNETELEEVNEILMSYQGSVSFGKSGDFWGGLDLSSEEKERLLELNDKLQASILKNEQFIYYEFWGYSNSRSGILYSINGEWPKTTQTNGNLKGNWYY